MVYTELFYNYNALLALLRDSRKSRAGLTNVGKDHRLAESPTIPATQSDVCPLSKAYASTLLLLLLVLLFSMLECRPMMVYCPPGGATMMRWT